MDILQKWYNKYKKRILAIYTFGSRANKDIENPEDYDYAVIAKNTESYGVLVEHKHDLEESEIHLVLFDAQT